jgi:dTDP-glucose 4,6-dehydratase
VAPHTYDNSRDGMKLIITGGAGFIGSSVIRRALHAGYSVLNIDVLTYAASLESLRGVSNHPAYTFAQIDIQNKSDLVSEFNHFEPDAVIHLAAETHVDRSIDDPSIFVQTNVLGTLNLLEVSRKYWDKNGEQSHFRFLHVSTDEVFGSLSSNSSELFTEKTPYDPRSPYSASKASSDHLVRAWNKTFGFPILITNCSNNYGPRQFPEKLIPKVILNALCGLPLPVYGSGKNIRDWLYVDDHADALLKVLEKGELGRTYNIGGGSQMSNLEVVQLICELLENIDSRASGKYEDLITFVEDRPGHDTRYAIDFSRIEKELGWSPQTSFTDGLETTVNWYLDNTDWWKPILSKHKIGARLGKNRAGNA